VSRTRVPRHFDLSAEHHEESVTLRLAGELDIACEEFVETALQPFEMQHDSIVLDLTALSFIDSTGLRLLIALHERSRRHGFGLSVVPGDGHVRRTLELTGLDSVLPIVDCELARETAAR
jgi:anti-anti-sigma factor